MKALLKTSIRIVLSIGGLITFLVIAHLIYKNFFYELELNKIRNNLNAIENVEVIDIWGHKDITLEEISVRLRIKEKGQIVLYGLSRDVFNYPDRVLIMEIGGHSFTQFSCNGKIGPCINIGTTGELGHLINKEFKNVKDVVDNYDYILKKIETLKYSPEINHFETEKTESYLLVEKKTLKDQEPILNLVGIQSKFEFVKTLTWSKSDCYYNKKK